MEHRVYADRPALNFEDGMPIGNGRLGAMIPGAVNDETIVINEETLWYGGENDRLNPDAKDQIAQIRRLLLKGKIYDAEFLAKMSFTGTPKYNHPYQPVGNLRITIKGHKGKAEKYKRFLDLDRAIASVSYEMEGISCERECLADREYGVIAIRMRCAKKGLSVCANLNRKPFEDHTGIADEKTAALWGRAGEGGVFYFAGVTMTADAPVKTMGDFVYTENAHELVIYVAAATDFADPGGYRESCLQKLKRAAADGYEMIRKHHLAEYEALYKRMSLSLDCPESSPLTTRAMMESLRKGDLTHANELAELMFAFARYLMISSSHDCLLPANLQGIWNDSFVPSWQSQYTININTEMNYWFVQKAGLEECEEPLYRLIERLAENGKKTAERMYGCRGFCAHHNTGLRANTEPEGIFASSPFWVMGGAWLSLHLYEHYLYSLDETFLKERALPVMGEAIRFFGDYLYHSEEGLYLTGPSVSPENTYRSKEGEVGALCMAPTMDSMILRQLCRFYLEGCEKAKAGEEELKETAADILKHLPETKLTKDGRIREWYLEHEETEPGHRHISHLFGLHPGNEITIRTPGLLAAAEKTVDTRLANGGGHTGWSKAWVICFYARLHKGEKAGKNMVEMLQHSVLDSLLDVHPPFQIDGNFGLAEGMLESLAQSHAGVLDFLPALPPLWKNGSVRGMKVRGNITADFSWKEGRLTELFLTAKTDMSVQIRIGTRESCIRLPAGIRTEVHISDSEEARL